MGFLPKGRETTTSHLASLCELSIQAPRACDSPPTLGGLHESLGNTNSTTISSVCQKALVNIPASRGYLPQKVCMLVIKDVC